MSVRLALLMAAAASLLAGCSHAPFPQDVEMTNGEAISIKDEATPVHTVATDYAGSDMTGPPIYVHGGVDETTVLAEHQAVADADGPYLLDTADRLRIFVYGQPNLSRLYTVDHEGRIAVPLIGTITARGKTTSELQGAIRARLGAEFVKDPQVTVDVQQNRPFFIYGEVKTAGQYPYVSGMTIETAIAIAGGYTERASERKFRLTRRVNGFVEQMEAPRDYIVKPGDTVYVFERFF